LEAEGGIESPSTALQATKYTYNSITYWQHYYNWDRPHSAHQGRSPMERYFSLADDTPFSDEAYESYNPASERLKDPNYRVDLELRRLKRSL